MKHANEEAQAIGYECLNCAKLPGCRETTVERVLSNYYCTQYVEETRQEEFDVRNEMLEKFGPEGVRGILDRTPVTIPSVRPPTKVGPPAKPKPKKEKGEPTQVRRGPTAQAKVVVDPNAPTRLAAHEELLKLDDPPYLKLRNLAYEEYDLPQEHAYTLRNGYVIHFILNQMIARGRVRGDSIHMDLKALDPADQTQRPDEREMLAFEHQLALLVGSGQAVMPIEAEGINVSEVRKHATSGKIANGQTGAARPRPQQPKAAPPAVEPEVEDEGEETQQVAAAKYPPIGGSKRTVRGAPKPKVAPEPEPEAEEAAGDAEEGETPEEGDEDTDGEGAEQEEEAPPPPPARRGAPKMAAAPVSRPAPVAAAPRAPVAAVPRLATPVAAGGKVAPKAAAAPVATAPKAAAPTAAAPAGSLPPGFQAKIEQLVGGVTLLVDQVKEANERLEAQAKEIAELRDSHAYLTKRVADMDVLLCYSFRRTTPFGEEGTALIEESGEDLTSEATMAAYGVTGPQ